MEVAKPGNGERFKPSSLRSPCVQIAPSTSTVPAEHGWFMHRPCKSDFFGSTPKAGLCGVADGIDEPSGLENHFPGGIAGLNPARTVSAEGKLRGGYTTLPLDGRGCTNQTNWTCGLVGLRRVSSKHQIGDSSSSTSVVY